MEYRTIILGAGAAGMMAAIHAGDDVLVLDHAKRAGEKIRISGGGRCNFTNMYAGPENFLSANPHFTKSALSRYTQWDFIDLVAKHGIAYHEKTLGQLFCDNSAKDIIAMLLDEMAWAGATMWLETTIDNISKTSDGFELRVSKGSKSKTLRCENLVIATGGKSIPKMGATGFAYKVAAQFGIPVTETRAGLVPFVFSENDMVALKPLAGVASPARLSCNGTAFDEALLITHRGMSGPSVLQISSYWNEGDTVFANLMPVRDAFETLRNLRKGAGAKDFANVVSEILPKKLAQHLVSLSGTTGNFADQSDTSLRTFADLISNWPLKPIGTEGYRTAEVTLGGIDTDALSSKTMETKTVDGLYFIGEAVDVTGWLGGFNFQWAWSSGWAAGQAISSKG